MNLIDAVKSGKPFKRPNYDEWIISNPLFTPVKNGSYTIHKMEIWDFPFIGCYSGNRVVLLPTAIIADDWEVFDGLIEKTMIFKNYLSQEEVDRLNNGWSELTEGEIEFKAFTYEELQELEIEESLSIMKGEIQEVLNENWDKYASEFVNPLSVKLQIEKIINM